MNLCALAFLATLLTGVVLIRTQNWHGSFSFDGVEGVQKLHEHPTPRIGGIAVAFGLWCTWLLTAGEIRILFETTLLSAMPALVFGLAEDVTKRVGVLPRLLATMGSGALAWYLTGVAMQDTGFAPLDWALQFLPFAVLFTAFAVGGVANSINIVDGFNGLAAGSVTIMAGAIGLIANNLGDGTLAIVCFITASCSTGFVAINWPFGKIFLGDGGAYMLGFVLAWVAVLLPMRNDGVNAWATMLVCAYPVIEVGFSVLRRYRRHGHQPGQADNLHLHHLIHRRVVKKVFPNAGRALQNGLTSPICWILVCGPALWAVAFANDTGLLGFGFAVSVLGYGRLYTRLTQFRWFPTKQFTQYKAS